MKRALMVNESLVISKIHMVRGQRIMLDEDLAAMYSVTTGRLNEQVKRNIERFPEDFMFQLTETEYGNLLSQFAIASWGGRRVMPYAFNEHGVLMLSSVLNSPAAIQVNIKIMRVYVKLRGMLLTHKDLLIKLEQLEKGIMVQKTHLGRHEKEIQVIFTVLKKLINPDRKPRKRIGFITTR